MSDKARRVQFSRVNHDYLPLFKRDNPLRRKPAALFIATIFIFFIVQSALLSSILVHKVGAPVSSYDNSSWDRTKTSKIEAKCPVYNLNMINSMVNKRIFLLPQSFSHKSSRRLSINHMGCSHASFRNGIEISNETRLEEIYQPDYSSKDDVKVKMPKEIYWTPMNSHRVEPMYYDWIDDDQIKDGEEPLFLPPPKFASNEGEKGDLVEGSDNCKPISELQTKSFHNCNTFHETDLYKDIDKFLNRGEYRDVWKLVYENSESIVLKTLRLADDKYFTAHRAEQHRVDAVASERLTSSPNVANIYGFCGQSAMNEIANPTGRVLIKGARKLSSHQRLSYAIDVAQGIAAAHGIEDRSPKHNITFSSQINLVSLVHRDVRSTNFLISKSGHMILHDFNCARFMTYDESTGASCGFYKRECDQDRAPEECWGLPLSEKIDVYSMGNVFYTILTGYTPYTYPKRYTLAEAGDFVRHGKTPVIPTEIIENRNPALQAIIKVIRDCWAYHPKDRPSAAQVAEELSVAYKRIYN